MNAVSWAADAAPPDTATESPPALVILGCGNPTRSDDGAGPAVIQALSRCPWAQREDIVLIDAGTSGMDVMFRMRGARRVLIIDACRSGSPSGAVFRLPGVEAMTPTEHGFTLHGLRWDHALYAGSKIFGPTFAHTTDVFLIEAGDLSFGLTLSPPVAHGVQQVVDQIHALIDHEWP